MHNFSQILFALESANWGILSAAGNFCSSGLNPAPQAAKVSFAWISIGGRLARGNLLTFEAAKSYLQLERCASEIFTVINPTRRLVR